MAILVTGGAGFIGTHTCVELLNSGFEVVVIDNFSNSKLASLRRVQEITGKKMKIYEGNLLSEELLNVIFSANEIEAVMHFAGLKAVGESVELPIEYYHNNITGTLLLCKMMQKYAVKRIVFSSSATVYGKPKRVPITEDFPLQATNPYGRTKVMMEEILSDLYQSDKDWSIAILRYFNPIGSHPSGRIGEDPTGIPSNLMPFMTQVALGKLSELKILGNDYPTLDGTGVRDFIHVVDLALGHLSTLHKVMAATGLEIYNLGTGKGYSVLEMIQTFEKVSGRKIPYSFAARRQGDIAECYADPSKAKRELGWTALRDIEEMCADAWRWQLENPQGFDEMYEVLSTRY